VNTIREIYNDHKLYGRQIMKLAKADLVKTYRGSALGWSWALVKPVVTIFVFWFAFSFGLRMGGQIDGYPFFLWLIAGFVPWFYMSSMITGVAVARTAFIEEHPEAVADFLEAYEASVTYVNENTAEAAALVGGYDIVPQPVAEKALPECNITFIAGEEMKEKLSGYLQVLCEQNPDAVGGEVPGEDFYYVP